MTLDMEDYMYCIIIWYAEILGLVTDTSYDSWEDDTIGEYVSVLMLGIDN